MYPMIVALVLGATPPGPLACPAPSADRGEVRTGPPLTHAFEVTNPGPDAVTVTAAESACGCLKPTVSAATIPAGGRATVTVTVNTLTQPAGANVWRTVVRYTAWASAHELALTVSATLVREVSVTPPALAVSTEGATTQAVTVTDRRAAPLTVTQATTTSKHLTAKPRPATTETGVRTQVIDVTVAADHPPGTADETLVLATTDPACPELRVPVKVTKRAAGEVVFAPENPEVRFARGQAEASVLVQLRRPGGGLVKVERVECAHAAVRGRWPDDAGPVATVRLVVDAAKAGGSGEALVRVVLADPPGREVTVPLKWSAAK